MFRSGRTDNSNDFYYRFLNSKVAFIYGQGRQLFYPKTAFDIKITHVTLYASGVIYWGSMY